MSSCITHEIFGVPGTLELSEHHASTTLFTTQEWKSNPRRLKGKDAEHLSYPLISVNVCFDDSCGNGRMSFAITGQYGNDREGGCGCIHEMIEEYFPELAHLIKWHGMFTDGPSHYIANTTYHASNRDHHGKLKGEPWAWHDAVKFGEFPITKMLPSAFAAWLKEAPGPLKLFEIVEVPYTGTGDYKFKPKYTFDDFGGGKWHTCPFDSREEAEQFKAAMGCGVEFLQIPCQWSDGKERNLDYARSTAIWPEATDEQLCLPKEELTVLLKARLPALIEEFRQAIASTGLEWREPQ